MTRPEQHVRFCNARDGVRLAYSAIGSGPPLFCVWGWSHNLDLFWQQPLTRRFKERLAQGRTMVSYERRGVGASQGVPGRVTLEGQLEDLAAVVGSLRLERFDLFGSVDGALLAAAYAARHPERVARLVMWSAFPSAETIYPPEAVQGLVQVSRVNWALVCRAIADTALPGAPLELVTWFATLVRESMTPEVAGQYLTWISRLDVRHLLPKVRVPALLLHRRGDRNVPIAAARAAAAAMPDARLLALEGESPAPWWGDSDAVIAAIDGFLREEARGRPYPDDLTAREVEVLRLLAEGRSNREIADRLRLSVRTVERHVLNIYTKTREHSRAAVTAYGIAKGIVPLPAK